MKGLKRNPEYIHKGLKKLPSGETIALKPCKIQIPKRFLDVNLAVLSEHLETVAIYAIIMDGYYGVSLTNALIKSKPSSTRVEKVDDVEYMTFSYEKGDVVLMDDKVVTLDVLVYYIWSEVLDKGKVPWYVDEKDRALCLMTARSHANVKMGANYALIEMITAVCTRDSKDRTKMWRYVLNKPGAAGKTEPISIGLRNIQFTVETDLGRLSGSYPEIGLMTSMARPAAPPEGLEKIVLL